MLTLFRRKASVVSLADQAHSFVDRFDRLRAQTIDAARKDLARVNSRIADAERARDALTAYLERETAIVETGMVNALERVIDEIGSEVPVIDFAPETKRARKLALAAAE